MLGIKQEALAFDLGVTQTTISDYKQKEQLEDKILEKVSQSLKVPVEAIKNMNEEATNNYINTFNDKVESFNSYNCTFNPLDKVVELYERMIKNRDELIDELSKK
ncbi:XRE family transcriptional regulator [Apibacter muscae]|nr:XRE family transcriptional regulator [Apibacter muscae]